MICESQLTVNWSYLTSLLQGREKKGNLSLSLSQKLGTKLNHLFLPQVIHFRSLRRFFRSFASFSFCFLLSCFFFVLTAMSLKIDFGGSFNLLVTSTTGDVWPADLLPLFCRHSSSSGSISTNVTLLTSRGTLFACLPLQALGFRSRGTL